MPASVCQACGGQIPDESNFCPSCGKDITTSVCQDCRGPLPEGSRFCPGCGKEVTTAAIKVGESCGTPVPEGSHLCSNCEQSEARLKAQQAAELAKREAEAARQRERQEKEAAKKAQESLLSAKREAEAIAREKARQEAEAATEKAKQDQRPAQVSAVRTPEGSGKAKPGKGGSAEAVVAELSKRAATLKTGHAQWQRPRVILVVTLVTIGVAVLIFALTHRTEPAPPTIVGNSQATPMNTPPSTPVPTSAPTAPTTAAATSVPTPVPAPPTLTPIPTPGQYRNPVWGYSVQTLEGWVVNDADKSLVDISPQTQGVVARITAFSQPGLTLETAVARRVAGIRAENPDYQEQSRTLITLPGGLRAYYINCTFTRLARAMRATAVVAVKESRAFAILGVSPATEWDKYSEDLQKMEYSLTVD